VAGREGAFFGGLVTACEATSYLLGVCYLVRYDIFGNPNNEGAALGVAIVPVLLWGVLITEERQARRHRIVALGVACFLLYSTHCRAGILASAVAFTTMCLALKRMTLLLKGAFVFVFLIAVLGVVQPEQFDSLVTSFTHNAIYKGKPELDGLLQSRQTPWQDTIEVIKASPWLGNGFGTDATKASAWSGIMFATPDSSVREHGSSYLALVDYVGLIGIVPFVLLLVSLLHMIYNTCGWMRRTGSPHHYAVPLAMVCIAGLVHAIFEDWLFAVGSYLNVFFWTSAFILCEVRPRMNWVTLRSAWDRSAIGTTGFDSVQIAKERLQV
jgi:O-antigen ligase